MEKEYIPNPGDEIVCTYSIGFAGICRLPHREKVRLQQRFIPSFLDCFAREEGRRHAEEAAEFLREQGDVYVQSLGRGGIFAGLWTLGADLHMGLCVQMKDFPLLQETIECCEYLKLNPYCLDSAGCFLFVTADGGALCEVLRGRGVSSRVIGQVNASNDRVYMRGEERCFLSKRVEEALQIYL